VYVGKTVNGDDVALLFVYEIGKGTMSAGFVKHPYHQCTMFRILLHSSLHTDHQLTDRTTLNLRTTQVENEHIGVIRYCPDRLLQMQPKSTFQSTQYFFPSSVKALSFEPVRAWKLK
jgi:hypothetical protein